MTIRGWRRKVVALGALAAAAMLSVAAPAQPAAADGRTLVADVGCASGIAPPWAFPIQVNYGSGWVNADATRSQIPGKEMHEVTLTIPTTASSVAVDAICFVDRTEFNRGILLSQVGPWIGWSASIVPGSAAVRTSWVCERRQVFPGPWVHDCARTA
jgi:hypothetical protein